MSELVIKEGQSGWNDQQKAALVQMGLGDASRADIEVFFHQAQRTGLDPFSRQIYMIGRWDNRSKANKYTIQTSIDGFRIIRDRKGTWRGQEEQWCGADGVWRDVWLSPEPPVAARVLLDIEGFSKPVPGVALWSEYAPMKDGKPTGMWNKMPALMLAKCAEALALRKAYPNDLSSLYTTDEMAQAQTAGGGPAPTADRVAVSGGGSGRGNPEPLPPVAALAPTRDWGAELEKVSSRAEAAALYQEAENLGELGIVVGQTGDKDDGSPNRVVDLFWARRSELDEAEKAAMEPMVVVEAEKPKQRNWVREARAMTTWPEVKALYVEATAAGAPGEALRQIQEFGETLPEPENEKPASAWPDVRQPGSEWQEPGESADAPMALEVPAEGGEQK